jgi:hypothetical protein
MKLLAIIGYSAFYLRDSSTESGRGSRRRHIRQLIVRGEKPYNNRTVMALVHSWSRPDIRDPDLEKM